MDNVKVTIGLSDIMEGEGEFIPIVEEEDFQLGKDDADLPEVLPLLPLRNMVLFPGVIVPISVGREKSLKLVRDVQKQKGYLGSLAHTGSGIE